MNTNNIGSSFVSKFSLSHIYNNLDPIGRKKDDRSNSAIAYHQIVNTYEVESYLAKQLQNNGIYMFGGQFIDGYKDN